MAASRDDLWERRTWGSGTDASRSRGIESAADPPFRSATRSWSRLEDTSIGRHGPADPADGVATGWAGGDHVLDLNFDCGKNIVDDALHLAIRIDTDKIPGALAAGLHPDRDRGPAPS